jgi:hypothetical protein
MIIKINILTFQRTSISRPNYTYELRSGYDTTDGSASLCIVDWYHWSD